MTASTMIRRLHETPIPVSFADDTYADSLTKWSVALELNPDNLGKSELFGVLVSVAMSMMLQGKTQEDFADWYQFSWAASEKLGRSNKRNKSDILQLIGTPSRDRVVKQLLKAWKKAQHHDQAKVLPDVSALRQRLETPPSHTMGGSVSTPNSGGRGRPRSDALLKTFDDLVAERQRLNQEEFTYPCRPAGERLGISPIAVSNRLKRLVKLGIVVQVEQGQVCGLGGEGFAHASRYRFIVPAMGGVVSITPSTLHKSKPKKKRPPCKLPLKVMKRLDQVTSLTYQTVLDHGGDVTHWKRWLRHLDSHRLDSQEDRYRWVVAKNDPQGSVAVDAHQRRQELKAYEFLHGADPGAADRRRMVAAMNAHGIPRGSEVTVELVRVAAVVDYEHVWVESYRFSTDCPVAEQMLASLGDVIGMLRAESAIRLMEAYGVLVDREYPAGSRHRGYEWL
jgi:hypothetical protein